MQVKILAILLCGSLLDFGTVIADDEKKPSETVASKKQTALELIEGVRGGRHWVNAATAPPKSPVDSKKCLEIEPGFEIELFAAEPLVKDPVAIAFDREGKIFVVEYGDYPIGPEKGEEPLSRVVYLEDTNGDNVADRRHLFADKLDFCHSLMAYDGGLIVGAKTQILFLKDTDGDHVADVRKVLFEGFTPAHPQMQIGNPRWGIDNWIYLNYGPGSIRSAHEPGKTVEMPRKDFRFHPATMKYEADSGMGQFGNTVDRWGRRYYCTNRNPIITTLLSPHEMTRNRYSVISKGFYDVARSGGESRVYPLVEMKSNYLSHAGTHTSACGVTAYLGDLFGDEERDSVFVCEPIGHLVTRSRIVSKGSTLSAERVREKADFIASTDTWFRPASLANGPDGALYLADMYRLWVEHPKFLPPEIAAKLDWRAGEDRGRIYRIVPKNAKLSQFQSPDSTSDMIALMESSNGWRQFLGQRLIVREKRSDAIARLRELLKSSNQATTRLHVLWTLEGLGAIQAEDILVAFDDNDSHVRENAVKLSARWLIEEEVFDRIAELASDADAGVRFQVVLILGESGQGRVSELLIKMALRDGSDPWFRTGLLTSCATRAGAILVGLVSEKDFVSREDPAATELVDALASVVGSRGDVGELSQVFNIIAAEKPEGFWWRAAAIKGLGQGLPRHRGALGRRNLPELLGSPPMKLMKSATGLRELLARIQSVAVDSQQRLADRTAAVGLLGFESFDQTEPTFKKLLMSGQPVGLQLASIDAISANGSPSAAQIVLERWSELGPEVRGPALALLLRRSSTLRQTLEAMRDGSMLPSALSIDQRVRLLKHSDSEIKQMATKLFGGAVSSNRREVAEKYRKALTLKGTSSAGMAVFKKTCAKCHKLDGKGALVGPDITDVRNRSRMALLYDILDPNAKVEPRFTAYTVVTLDGKIFTGLIASETNEAIVLRMAEGKQQIIGRNEIDEVHASKISLMPEGVEKDIKLQDMADLLEFLKSRK